MLQDTLALKAITGIADPALVGFLKLIESAFPPYEIMPPSFWIRLMQSRAQEDPEGLELYIVQDREAPADPEKMPIGLVMLEADALEGLVTLWYLAVAPTHRNQGIGRWILEQVAERFRADPAFRALVLEIERRDQAEDEAHLEQIVARERFYQRSGGRIARHVDYLQSVGAWMPPTPMSLCILFLQEELTSSEVTRLFSLAFQDGIQSLPEDLGLE